MLFLPALALLAVACAPIAGKDAVESTTSPSGTTTPSSASSPSGDATPAATGLAAQDADEIVRQSVAAFGEAKSVRVSGQHKEKNEDVVFDLRMERDGDLAGSITNDGLHMKVIRSNKAIYAAGADLWKDNPTAARRIGDSYVRLPGDPKEFRDLTISKIAGEALNDLKTGSWTKAGEETVNGQRALKLSVSDGTLYVAATGKPYPLRIDVTGTDSDDLDFREYDKKFNIAPPKNLFRI